MNISDSKHDEVRKLAKEILDARIDDEFNEACRAIKAVIEAADCDPATDPRSALRELVAALDAYQNAKSQDGAEARTFVRLGKAAAAARQMLERT